MSVLSTSVSGSIFSQFYALTKPRVVQLIVFCALIGMVLAVPGVPTWIEVRLALIACLGIWLVADICWCWPGCPLDRGLWLLRCDGLVCEGL